MSTVISVHAQLRVVICVDEWMSGRVVATAGLIDADLMFVFAHFFLLSFLCKAVRSERPMSEQRMAGARHKRTNETVDETLRLMTVDRMFLRRQNHFHSLM